MVMNIVSNVEEVGVEAAEKVEDQFNCLEFGDSCVYAVRSRLKAKGVREVSLLSLPAVSKVIQFDYWFELVASSSLYKDTYLL